MQLQVTVLAFIVCVSLISAGKHHHRGECREDEDEDELEGIPAGGYEPEDKPQYLQIHHERPNHHSLFQHDTPLVRTGTKSIRKRKIICLFICCTYMHGCCHYV